jgi:hypothetical protein
MFYLEMARDGDGRRFAVVLAIVGRVHRQFRPEDQLPLPLETCNRKTNKNSLANPIRPVILKSFTFLPSSLVPAFPRWEPGQQFQTIKEKFQGKSVYIELPGRSRGTTFERRRPSMPSG